MTLEEFVETIRGKAPEELAHEFLMSETVFLFGDAPSYSAFKARITGMLTPTQHISVVGSGNWRYSLNPEKLFREFCDKSDVDVAIVSNELFNEYWEEMRMHHRMHFYALSYRERTNLRRSGENVYAGFISPAWIPNRDRSKRYEYQRMLNSLSDSSVRYLKVKMLIFKNRMEAVDYYARGFRLAKQGRPE